MEREGKRKRRGKGKRKSPVGLQALWEGERERERERVPLWTADSVRKENRRENRGSPLTAASRGEVLHVRVLPLRSVSELLLCLCALAYLPVFTGVILCYTVPLVTLFVQG